MQPGIHFSQPPSCTWFCFPCFSIPKSSVSCTPCHHCESCRVSSYFLLIQSCSPPELSCSSRSFFLGERLGVSALCSAQCFAEIVQSPSAQWNKIFSAAQMIPDCVHVPQGAVELEVNSLIEAGMGSVMNRV